MELQGQLDHVVQQLESSQLEKIQLQNQSQRSDHLQKQLTVLAADYRTSELEHQKYLEDLVGKVDELTKQLLASKARIVELESLPTSSGDFTSSTFRAATVLVDQSPADWQAKVTFLENQNAQLATLTESQDQELIKVWERVYDLHSQLKEARNIENDFRTQSVAIEQLRVQIDDGEEAFEELKAALPPKEARLKKSQQGDWEWTPWVKELGQSVWDQDFQAVKAELQDLKVHRAQAFARAQSRTKETAFQIASYIPFATLPLTVLLGPPLDEEDNEKIEWNL